MHTLGRYRLVQEVGRGGMGVVWRGQGPDGQPVAIKLLLAGRAAGPAQRERFQRELQAHLRLRHPNVVRLLDAGAEQGAPFLVLEWVPGESLHERLARAGPLDPRQAVEVARRLALALAHCHAQGVLHRDLKPGNVLLRASDGEPLLTDFGLARELTPEEGSQDGAPLSRTGAFLGSPGWWAPEQARGERAAIGPRADVFGLGALLFGMLTGRPPLPGDGLQEALAACERPAPPPSALRPGLPAALDRLCARCLALDPGARHASAQALAEDLARWQREGPGRGRSGLLLGAGGVAAAAALTAWLSLPGRAPAAPAAAAPPAPRTSPAASDTERLVAEARQAWHAHDLDRALARAAAALMVPDAGPLAAEARLVRAQVLALRQQGALAQAEAQRAREASPDPGVRALAEVLLAAGAPPGRLLDAAVRLRADDPDPWFWRGTARQAQGDQAGAAADYDRALALAPDFMAALHNRGAARLGLGDARGAADDAGRALALDPQDAQSHYNRGLARMALNDQAGALADFVRAHELDAQNARAWARSALLRYTQGDLRGTVADATRALELDPGDADAWHYRGLARFDLEDPSGAEEDYTRALRLDPDRPETLANRGSARQLRGDLPGAIADFQRALALFPPGSAPAVQVRGILDGLGAR